MDYYEEDIGPDLLYEEEYNNGMRDAVTSLGYNPEKDFVNDDEVCIDRDYDYDDFGDVDELSFDEF